MKNCKLLFENDTICVILYFGRIAIRNGCLGKNCRKAEIWEALFGEKTVALTQKHQIGTYVYFLRRIQTLCNTQEKLKRWYA